VADPLPGMPPVSDPHNVYSNAGAGMLNDVTKAAKPLVYVPHTKSGDVWVIDPATFAVVGRYAAGVEVQHVVPSYDMRTLYATDDLGNTIIPFDPNTGKPGPRIPVTDPYNLYFTPDGRRALVMAENRNQIDFRDPHTMRLVDSVRIPAAGINHMDFTVDGGHAVASCEFGGAVVWIDMRARRVTATLTLGKSMDTPAMATAAGPGYAMPQDVRLSADGALFYVADMAANGIWLIDAYRFRRVGFVGTGMGAHGLQVARDGRRLFISNRGEGSVSVLDMRDNRLLARWRIPGGGSPDMGGINPDGKVMWWGGRYNGVVYAMSTVNGRLIAEIPVESGPHGVCVFPQPGRYSLGHTGNFR